MKLSIQKWGNSAAVRLPSALLDHLGISAGDQLEVDIRPDGFFIKPAKPHYSLAELLAQCDAAMPVTEDIASWDRSPSAGKEAW
nr:AbrB/MazE/SpoVT family DNA-binding domain-containing protein [uncultured Noviherbaspirillum sp.]